MSAQDFEAQESEWKEHAAKELASGRCPYSGGEMRKVELIGGQQAMMCIPCDCFGYPPEEVGAPSG